MINKNNNISDLVSISATTYYGDGSNLTGISGGGTFTGGTVTGETIFSGGLSGTTISGGTFYGDGSNLTDVLATANKFTVNCRNDSGADMYRGQIVYVNSSTGNKPTIRLAQANSEATSARTFGEKFVS